MVLRNPMVKKRFVGGVENISALNVLDEVVSELTAQNLMVILNSHTSTPSWIGIENGWYEEAPQGLWHDSSMSTADWVQALVTVAQRYADNALVVGIDLRNEIHDQRNITITWAESDNVETDWLAASTLAERAIAKVNPDVLIIVSGLCRAYDLRQMIDTPGPTLALYRKKLVYTTHAYVFSMWWTRIDIQTIHEAATVGMLLTATTLIILITQRHEVVFGYRRLESTYLVTYNTRTPTSSPIKTAATAATAALFPFACVWVVVALIKADVAYSVGCSTVARESIPWLAAGIFLVLASTGAIIVCRRAITKGSNEHFYPLITSFVFWMHVTCAAISAFCFTSHTYWMVEQELSRWSLSNRAIPVWLGEFGTDDDSQTWRYLLQIIRNHDLDFAYWPLNGRKWGHGHWRPETYGLVNENYTEIRNQSFVDDLFKQ
jgi:hypothetical protein